MKALIRYLVIFFAGVLVASAFIVYESYATTAFAPILEELQRAFRMRFWVDQLFRFLPLVVSTAGIITFSVGLGPYDLGNRGALIGAIRPVLAFILLIGTLYGVWLGVFGPQQRVRMEQIRYYSSVARSAWEEARQARSTGRLDAARRYAEIYLSVVGEDDDVRAFLNAVKAEIQAEETSRRVASYRTVDDGGTGSRRFIEVSELSVSDLMNRAREYFQDGHYFSAHYLASRAVEMSRGHRTARALQAEALNAIQGESFEIEDEPARDLYRRKMVAYELLQRGDPEENPEALILAHFRFQELLGVVPNDPDVLRFGAEAEEKVEEISFYVEDARMYGGNHFTGRSNIFFRNRSGGGLVEYITAKRLVQSPEGDFFFDVEILQQHEDGYLHFRSDFAKRIDDNLFFRAIEGDPAYSTDEERIHRPHRMGGDSAAEIPGYIPLIPDIDEVILLSAGSENFEGIPLTGLFKLPPLFVSHGRSEPAAAMAAASRITGIIGYFIVALGSVAFGWRYRSFYLARLPFLAILAIPLVPLILWWLRGVPGFLLALMVFGLSRVLSGIWIVVFVSAVLLVLLVVTVAFLARRRVGT
jgi:hypothetical protein